MIDLQRVSCCLITKDPIYPGVIINQLLAFPFGEVLILTHCDSPHRKQELFEKAKFQTLFYQDDDCIAPVGALAERSAPAAINCAMKTGHLRDYKHSRVALLGWGALFPKSAIEVLNWYRAEHGEDAVYKRESERIMTWLNWPQNRMDLPIRDLPSASAADRLSMQANHRDFIPIVEQRCAAIEAKRGVTQ